MTPEQLKAIEETQLPVTIHRDGVILFVNRATVEMAGGKGPDELIGKKIADFLAPAYRFAADMRFRRLLAGKPLLIKNARGTLLRLDGSKIDATATPFLVDYEGAKAIMSVVIRDHRRAEPPQDAVKRFLDLFA